MKLSIFGMEVPIKTEKGMRERFGRLGQYNSDSKTIVLDANLGPKDKMSTLLHECIHAYVDRMGVYTAISGQFEEILAEQISKLILENFNVRVKT